MPRLAEEKPLDVLTFGKRLVETQDLDPVYSMLWKAEFGKDFLEKWLMAYWCFYHCGTASWIADQANYWDAMSTAAGSVIYKRGTERRHFRGAKAISSVQWLREAGLTTLFNPFYHMPAEGRIKLKTVMDYVQTWVQFGPWIAFKVADMLDRLDIVPIDFTTADTFLFKSPREGAALVAAQYSGAISVDPEEEPEWAFQYLDAHLGRMLAPPRFERKLNGQEYETILCKWKSHLNGHYNVGHDIEEIRKGLGFYPFSITAQYLKDKLP